MLKKSKNILRILFIGVILIYSIVKIFDIKPTACKKEHRRRQVDDEVSEFDEIW